MKKKLLCLFLCLVMMAALFAGCSETTNKPGADHVLQTGYARVDVTPADSMPLAGFGDNRVSGEVLDPLYITCVAFKDEAGNTFLMYHCDFLSAYAPLLFNKKAVAKQTGVPQDNIIVASTHNHSAPTIDADSDRFPLVEDYQKLCKDAMIKSAQDAIADLKPSKMYVTRKQCENMTYVRHFVRKNDTVNGRGGSAGEAASYKGYASQVDDNMELIKFVREGGKDILLMNWQGHPRGHGTLDRQFYGESQEVRKSYILSDVNQIRVPLEEALDCHFAYFLGASGNVNNSTWIAAHQLTKNYEQHGQKLAELAVEASANFTEVKTGTLKRAVANIEATSKNGDEGSNIPISVFAIGEAAAFAIVPYEMFSQSALDIKEASTFDLTFVVTCADGSFGYMPTDPTFDYDSGAYETDVTNYARGTAEQLVDGYKSLLNQLKPSAS